MDNTYRELDEADACYVRLFWRLVTRQKNRKKHQISEILYNNRHRKSPKDIWNTFADFYADFYIPKENAKFDRDFMAHVTEFVGRTLESCAANNGIIHWGKNRNPKLRKVPGYDKLQNEHVRYEHVTEPFKVQQVVTQVGVISTLHYLVYIADLLNE